MTKEAREFVTRIKREASRGVQVRVGQTNGLPAFHIKDLDAPDGTRAATTIFTEADWIGHPLNRTTRARPAEPVTKVDGEPDAVYSTRQQSVEVSRISPKMREALALSAKRDVVTPDGEPA